VGHGGLGGHAQHDDLEGDAAADGFLLSGHANDAAPAFAQFLERFLLTDARADHLVRRSRAAEFDRPGCLRYFGQE
jgi:hypothetical protein